MHFCLFTSQRLISVKFSPQKENNVCSVRNGWGFLGCFSFFFFFCIQYLPKSQTLKRRCWQRCKPGLRLLNGVSWPAAWDSTFFGQNAAGDWWSVCALRDPLRPPESAAISLFSWMLNKWKSEISIWPQLARGPGEKKIILVLLVAFLLSETIGEIPDAHGEWGCVGVEKLRGGIVPAHLAPTTLQGCNAWRESMTRCRNGGNAARWGQGVTPGGWFWQKWLSRKKTALLGFFVQKIEFLKSYDFGQIFQKAHKVPLVSFNLHTEIPVLIIPKIL